MAVVAVAAVAAAPAALAVPLPDTSANGEWWFNAFQVPKIWALGAQGQGVTVAVLDSGVNAARPELAGRVLPGTDLIGGGDGRHDRDRSRGHGTAMALFIAAQGGPSGLVGVAPRASILPVAVSGGAANGEQTITDGIRWAVGHGAKVVNISLGPVGECPIDVQSAVRDAVDHGAVVVASSGNEGSSSNPAEYPADCAGVLAVGAVDAYRHVWSDTQQQSYVDVAAPGVNMASINAAGEAGKSNGTSDAAALTSAAIALVWSKLPSLTNRQVVARVLATLRDDADRPGRDDATGMGIVRPYNAITQAVPANAPNPVFDELNRLPGASPSTPVPSTSAGGTGGGAPGSSGQAQDSSDDHRLSRSAEIGAVAGVAGLLVIGVLVAVVLLATRRRRRPVPTQPMAPPPPSWPPPPPPPPYRR